METRIIKKSVVLLLSMLFSFVCYSQIHVQSRDVKRISGKAYLISNGNQYEIRENVLLAKLMAMKKQANDDIKVIKSHPFGMIEIAVPDSIAIEEYIKVLDKSGDFQCVEYDTYSKPCMSANDAFYYDQWGPDAIHADAAWEITTGSPSVKVAVIDTTGYELYHPDLYYGADNYANISVSEYVDYVYPNNPTPTSYHGTMVAGIISAKTNNMVGIAGIAGGNNSAGSKIIPYRAKTASQDILSIYDAVSKGVKVINMSFSVAGSSLFDTAIDYAYNNGVTIVCASGNEYSSQIDYPASHEHTIAVGSMTSSYRRATSSNYGEGLDLVAPGVGIRSTATSNENYYYVDSGTSYATPYVSGVVALMLSVNPNLTPDGIKSILHDTAKKLSSSLYPCDSFGWNEKVGYGLLHACAAVMVAKNYSISGPTYVCNASTDTYTVYNLPSSFTISWSFTDGTGPVEPSIVINGHTYILTNNLSKSYMGTLNARILYNGVLMTTLKKNIVAYGGFYGIYYIGGYASQEFFPNTPIWVAKGGSIHLKSPNLVTKNVSYSVTTPSSWLYYGGTGDIYVTYPNVTSNNPILISVQNDSMYSNCDDSYQIVIMPNNVLPSYSLSPIVGSNGKIIVSLIEKEYSDEVKAILETYLGKITKIDAWMLEVYNATTGKKVFSKEVSGTSYIIDSIGWVPGVYIIKVTIGSEELTEKITV